MRVEIDQAQLLKVKTMLGGVKNAPVRVMSRAINKTLTGTRTTAKREIAKHYNLTQKRINQDFRTLKSTFSNLRGELKATGKPVSLTSFSGTRQVKKGVSAKIKKDRPRFTLKHAFITTVKGSKQAFWREYSGTRKSPRPNFRYGILPVRYRKPINRLTGPRIEDEYAKPRTLNVVQNYAGDRIKVVMDQELNYELSKL